MQKQRFVTKLLAFLFMCFVIHTAHAENLTPVGTWVTVDDETEKPRSIVNIWETNGELRGKVMKIFWREDEVKEELCVKCPGTLKDKPKLGMTIIWGMTPSGDEWNGGFILDPRNGKVYHAKLSLENNGQLLKVRGYVAIPLIGRSQTWVRQ